MQRTNLTQFYWQRVKFVWNSKSFSLSLFLRCHLQYPVAPINLFNSFTAILLFNKSNFCIFFSFSFCLLFILAHQSHWNVYSLAFLFSIHEMRKLSDSIWKKILCGFLLYFVCILIAVKHKIWNICIRICWKAEIHGGTDISEMQHSQGFFIPLSFYKMFISIFAFFLWKCWQFFDSIR